MEPAAVIDLQHVTVVRGGRAVLHDVSLRVERGEQVALLGPNGCGKSTLLKTLSGELYPLAAEGTRVRLFGRERWDLTALKRRLGVVGNEIPGKPMLKINGRDAMMTGFFSSSTLWPNLEVTAEMGSRVEEMMERVGAVALRGKLFGEMSAGQQRRVLIGRALVGSADCLLLDEPSDALDLAAQRGLRELLVELAAGGTTMAMITHHVADIIPAMRRVVLMREGRIVADGVRRELLTEGVLGELFGTEVRLGERDGFVHAW